jgi:prepilin-type N-terminal cleavage/methylation domain-containing protein
MRGRLRPPRRTGAVSPVLREEAGFTLLEVMIAIVLMSVGLLAAAGSFPALTTGALYAKDQTRASNLAQQQLEVYRSGSVSSLAPLVGDFRTKVATQYFDQNGNRLTASTGAYFVRDVQVQYWTYVTNGFTPSSPYTTPTAGTTYLYRISVATHWHVRGQTAFTSGNVNSANGCVVAGIAVPVARGCITVSSFAAP